LVGYPITVSAPSDSADYCYVTIEGSTEKIGECTEDRKSRLFTIKNAYPKGYSGTVTIHLKLINPPNNWGTLGMILKTQEEGTTEDYYMD
jgi:hypothetical protein